MIKWPEDFDAITCVGFNEALLPILISAIDADHVKWETIRTNEHVSDGRYSEFDYLGFRYSLDELYEPISTPTGEMWDFVPVRIEKIAKVDVNEEGETIIIESYPYVPQKPKAQPRPESWGTF